MQSTSPNRSAFLNRLQQLAGTMSEPDVQEIVEGYEVARVMSTVYLSACAALAYHYVITFDEEVKYVWPQARWKLGKIIFLTTRYSALILMAGYMVFNMPNHATLSITCCRAMSSFVQVCTAVNTTFTEASLWLCLYALLEGKPRYFCLVILMLLGFTIPIYVLQCMYAFTQKPIPLDPLAAHLGWACGFTGPDSRYEYLYSIGMYLSAARSLVAIVLGLVTFIVRYRRQRGRLIRNIMREGGIYLALTLVLKLVIAIAATPKSPIEDKYDVLWGLNRVFGNVFAERLLLSLRKVDDPGTRAVISSLAFDKTSEGLRSSTDSESFEGTQYTNDEEGDGKKSKDSSTGVGEKSKLDSHA